MNAVEFVKERTYLACRCSDISLESNEIAPEVDFVEIFYTAILFYSIFYSIFVVFL